MALNSASTTGPMKKAVWVGVAIAIAVAGAWGYAALARREDDSGRPVRLLAIAEEQSLDLSFSRSGRLVSPVPDEGETTFGILGGSGSALDVPDPTTVLDVVGYPGGPEGDAEAFLKPDSVHAAFAQDLSETDRWLIAATQRPLTISANTTPSGPPAWKSLPSWAVIGLEDRVIPPDTQRKMAERAGATITDVAASHVSMVSHPQVTIDAILAAVAAVGD